MTVTGRLRRLQGGYVNHLRSRMACVGVVSYANYAMRFKSEKSRWVTSASLPILPPISCSNSAAVSAPTPASSRRRPSSVNRHFFPPFVLVVRSGGPLQSFSYPKFTPSSFPSDPSYDHIHTTFMLIPI